MVPKGYASCLYKYKRTHATGARRGGLTYAAEERDRDDGDALSRLRRARGTAIKLTLVASGDEARTRGEKTGGQENLTLQGDAPLAAASKEDDAPSGGNPVRLQALTYAQTSAEETRPWRRRRRCGAGASGGDGDEEEQGRRGEEVMDFIETAKCFLIYPGHWSRFVAQTSTKASFSHGW